MTQEPTLCVVCAWREDCVKKFLHSQAGSSRCFDFTRDVTIKKENVDDQKADRGDRKEGP